jgi:putative membrane protein
MSSGGQESRVASRASAFKPWLLGGFVALWIASCIDPPWPHELILQHIPTVIAIALLITLDRYQPLSLASFTAVLAFLSLHLLGARYLYSNVPYREWFDALVGGTSSSIHWQRNHYDRLVHFCYGLMLVLVVREVLDKSLALPRGWGVPMAIGAILASSALYELLEWLVAVALSPDQAEAYNGQQGDMWDAQKDMALALAGAIAGCLAGTTFHCRETKPQPVSRS